MLLLTGASRMVGAAALPQLLAAGHDLRVLSSSKSSAERLYAAGVHDVVIGDLRSPNDLARALEGVDTVVLVVPSMLEDEALMGQTMIEAAERAGVGHLVFVSCFHALIPEMRHHQSKILIEQRLVRSSLSYTILQPSMFMQVAEMFVQNIIEDGSLGLPWDPGKSFCMLDTEDLGAAIVEVVANRRYRGGTYELASETMTMNDWARELSIAFDRDVKMIWVEKSAFTGRMRAAGQTEWSIETMEGLCNYHDLHGYEGGSSAVLEMILGRPANSYKDFASNLARKAKEGKLAHLVPPL